MWKYIEGMTGTSTGTASPAANRAMPSPLHRSPTKVGEVVQRYEKMATPTKARTFFLT